MVRRADEPSPAVGCPFVVALPPSVPARTLSPTWTGPHASRAGNPDIPPPKKTPLAIANKQGAAGQGGDTGGDAAGAAAAAAGGPAEQAGPEAKPEPAGAAAPASSPWAGAAGAKKQEQRAANGDVGQGAVPPAAAAGGTTAGEARAEAAARRPAAAASAASEAPSGKGDTATPATGEEEEDERLLTPARTLLGSSARVAALQVAAEAAAKVAAAKAAAMAAARGSRNSGTGGRKVKLDPSAAGAGGSRRETGGVLGEAGVEGLEEDEEDPLEKKPGPDAAVIRAIRLRLEQWREDNTKSVEQV